MELSNSGNSLSQAFNDGCDARLMGLSIDQNPYDTANIDENNASTNWRWGWIHVDKSWGVDVHGRWDYAPLPQVEE